MKNKTLKRIFNGIYITVSTGIIAIGIVVAVLYICGIRFYRVRSGSMGEAVPKGSLCFVSTYSSYENIDAGDIISFRLSDDVTITHRADSITEDGVITKGDCNQGEDPDPVTRDNYIGKTVFAIPGLGMIFGWLNTAKGRIIIVLFVIVIIVSGRLFRREGAES
jgi:signal peptidase